MRIRTWTDEQFINAIKNNFSVAGVLRDIGLKVTGANYKTVKITIKRLNLNTQHFTGMGHLKGKSHNWGNKKLINEYLVKDFTGSSSKLKLRLIKEGILDNICSICGINNWNNKPITLQLDHINGDNTDNRIENLRILCPNCHTQTETWGSKNKKRKSHDPKKHKCITCNTIINDRRSIKCRDCRNLYRAGLKKELNKCVCGIVIKNTSKTCKKCRIQQKKIIWPSYEELLIMTNKLGFVESGRRLGVSDNAIRKHIIKVASKGFEPS